jgi:hypothetical protein
MSEAKAIGWMAGEGGSMRKRLGVFGVVVALVSLLVGAVSPALGSSSGGADRVAAAGTEEQTLRLIFFPTDFAEIDNGDPGPSLGDDVVFSGNVRQDGARVGRVGVICTFVLVTEKREEAQCPTTTTLPGGQITTQGVIVDRSVNFTLPITGGSGEFEGAEGELVSQDASTATRIKLVLTYHLEG